jgi:4-amino-4-deoxy-L-arabinose transferase-like glycosyltransferase
MLLMLPGLGRTDLWGSDETRYAEVAREMTLSGDFIHLTENYEPYAKKPPLVFWLMVGASKLTGAVDEAAARLPSALAGVGVVLLAGWLGTILFGRPAGFWAALLLAVAPAMVKEARLARMDVVLTFFVCLSFVGFALFERRRAPGWVSFLLFFVPLPLGILSKWAAPVFVLPPVLLYLLLTGQRGRIPWRWLVPGLLIVVAPLVVWMDMGEYGRIVSGNVHQKPFYYHLLRYPLVLLPGVLLLPGAVWLYRSRSIPTSERRGVLLLLVWALTGLAILSLSGSKRSNYLDPLLAPGMLLAGWFAARAVVAARSGTTARFARFPAAGVAAVAVLGGLALAVYPDIVNRKAELPLALGMVRGAGIGAVVLGGAVLLAALRGPTTAALAGLAMLTALPIAAQHQVLFPHSNPANSVRPILTPWRTRAGEDAKLGFASDKGSLSQKWVYYSSAKVHRIVGRKGLDEWLRENEERFVIVRQDDFREWTAEIGGTLPAGVRVEADSRFEENDYVLLSNRKGPGDPVLLAPPSQLPVER